MHLQFVFEDSCHHFIQLFPFLAFAFPSREVTVDFENATDHLGRGAHTRETGNGKFCFLALSDHFFAIEFRLNVFNVLLFFKDHTNG